MFDIRFCACALFLLPPSWQINEKNIDTMHNGRGAGGAPLGVWHFLDESFFNSTFASFSKGCGKNFIDVGITH